MTRAMAPVPRWWAPRTLSVHHRATDGWRAVSWRERGGAQSLAHAQDGASARRRRYDGAHNVSYYRGEGGCDG